MGEEEVWRRRKWRRRRRRRRSRRKVRLITTPFILGSIITV